MQNTTKEKTSTAIEAKQTDNQIIANFDPQKQVEQAKVAAQALMSVIQQKTKKVEFNGEQYLEFEDWQTIAQFYNHTVGIEKTETIEQNGKIIGFVAKATLYHNGVIVGGAEAACMGDEDNWRLEPHVNKWGKTIPGKPLFQLRSMAQTRAMAKALRSRFGFVAVLAGFKPTPAEEMQDVFDKPDPKAQTPNVELYCSVHDNTIGKVPAGVSKKTGKPYKAFISCSIRENGKFCNAPILNQDGYIVKQNPETGEMEIEKSTIMDEPLRGERPTNEIIIGVDTPS
jgi:hypothetical protein